MQNLKTKIALIISSVLMPAVVLAQTNPPKPITNFQGILDAVNRISSWVFSILIALAVVFLLYAAYLYLDARGDEAKVGEAKSVIIYSIWAIGIALIAAGIPSLIGSFFGVNTP